MTGEASPSRRALHERSDSDSNALANSQTLRLVPSSPQYLRHTDDIFARTPLPTHPSHILLPGKGKGKDYALQYEFQHATKSPTSTGSASPVSTTYMLSQPLGESPTGSFSSKPKPPYKKRLEIHKDNKTFSLVPQDDSQPVEKPVQSPSSQTEATKPSDLVLPLDEPIPEEPTLPLPESPPRDPTVPATPAPESKQQSADLIATSSGDYELIGGLRKVPKTPDRKLNTERSEHPPLPELPHELAAKPSFQSAYTTTTTSENSNYKVYRDISPSTSEVAPASSSGNSNYQLHGDASPESSVIYRPRTSTSDNENYELHEGPSPTPSYAHLSRPDKYSQESLVVRPLNPRPRRSSENLGYYKSRSRESLRTGSLTSISTVLSHQETSRAIAGSGSLINVPNPNSQVRVTDSSADVVPIHPLRSHMNEYPHQWSSQLSTVHSVSEDGTDRGSRTWSDDRGRRSSGFISSSRHSRQMLSISSSLSPEPQPGASLEPPQPALMREGQQMGDQDEYEDVITDMADIRDLRPRLSRRQMSGLYSITSSEGRTNTMRSTGSSRANSLLASAIPTWAKLYYGSADWRFLAGTPASVSEASDSRANSFRSGSPNTDHFQVTLHSPRRRPREISNQAAPPARNSLEITPAPEAQPAPRVRRDGRSAQVQKSTPVRTWSMSSIWSPHLRLDKRATHGGNWGPPSVTWSTEGRFFGRRNVQLLMFAFGFIFPFGTHPIPSSPCLLTVF
jgi:hypothetical protein